MYQKISGTALAISPIIHGGTSRGTFTEFRRVKVVTDSGNIELLPVISGNSVRGILRDACAEFNLRAAGIERVRDLRTFHLLFSGGSLTKAKEESYINLEEEQRLRDLLPSLSLFGGSIGNRILGGKLEVSEWIPLCREMRHLVPGEYADTANEHSIYDLIDIISFTRRDDVNSRALREMLDDDIVSLYRQRKETLARADEAEEPGRAQQMYYEIECLALGTRLYVEFVLHNINEVELGAFLGGLALFATRPRIGGRSSSGLGRVKLDLKQTTINEPVALTGELTSKMIEVAREHLAARRDEIAKLVGGAA